MELEAILVISTIIGIPGLLIIFFVLYTRRALNRGKEIEQELKRKQQVIKKFKIEKEYNRIMTLKSEI